MCQVYKSLLSNKNCFISTLLLKYLILKLFKFIEYLRKRNWEHPPMKVNLNPNGKGLYKNIILTLHT